MGDGTSVYNMYQVDDAGVWELVEMKEIDIQNTHTHTHTHTVLTIWLPLCFTKKSPAEATESE